MLKFSPSKNTWRDRNGMLWKLCDMSDSHLLNLQRFILLCSQYPARVRALQKYIAERYGSKYLDVFIVRDWQFNDYHLALAKLDQEIYDRRLESLPLTESTQDGYWEYDNGLNITN